MAVPCGSAPVRLYVYAMLQGASQFGITGAEYRVTASNGGAGWLFAETFNGPAAQIGSAFPPNGGTNVAWADCQVGDGTKFLLQYVDIMNVSDCSGSEVILKVVKHFTASNQFFQCPLFTLCDAPYYSKVCLGSNLTTCQNPNPPFANDATCSTSGEAFLNPGPTRNCTVAVRNESWSTIKGLYRD